MEAKEIHTLTRERADALRPVTMERNWNVYAEGSCVISCGRTRVLCTATVEDKVPPFLRGHNFRNALGYLFKITVIT